MKGILLTLTAWGFAHAVFAGQTELSAEDAVVNLLLGPCLFEMAQIELPEHAIDPHAIGEPVGADNTDSRLSAAAIRVPTRSGTVYYDHDDGDCYTHADGVDAENALKHLRTSLTNSGLQIVVYGERAGHDTSGNEVRIFAFEVLPAPPIGGMPWFLIYYPADDPTTLSAVVAFKPFP